MDSEIALSGETLPSEAVSENKIAGLDQNWTTGEDWGGHAYAEVTIPDPDNRPMREWEVDERRAYLLTLLRKHGHVRRIPQNQSEIADWFDVTQQCISRDFKELRKYIRFHAGDTAISHTELVAEKAVRELFDDEDWLDGWRVQKEYTEWLFELGRLERAPMKKVQENINVDASAEGLTEREESLIGDLHDKLEKGQSVASEPIDVEARDVDDEEKSGE